MSDSNNATRNGHASPGVLAVADPHYRPLVPTYHTIQLVIEPGSHCWLERDDSGVVIIHIRAPRSISWPQDNHPPKEEIIHMRPPHSVLTHEARGPAVGHEFEPSPFDERRCMECARLAEMGEVEAEDEKKGEAKPSPALPETFTFDVSAPPPPPPPVSET